MGSARAAMAALQPAGHLGGQTWKQRRAGGSSESVADQEGVYRTCSTAPKIETDMHLYCLFELDSQHSGAGSMDHCYTTREA